MGQKDTQCLIAMALDRSVSKEEFSDAFFLHFVPIGRHGLERLLYVVAIHRPEIFIANDIDLLHVTKSADLIRCVQQQLQPKKRKAS